MFEGPLQDLIDEFSRLPGIGPKSAQRIAFYLMKAEPEDIGRLQSALGRVREGVQFCQVCGNISESDVCQYCSDTRRDRGLVCVVEEARDIQAIERTGEYNGRYHVLGGALDPLGGIGPNELNIRTLLQRIAGVLDDVDETQPPKSTRSSSRLTPTPRAKQPRPIWPGCCGTSRILRSPGWPPACHSVVTWSSLMNSPCPAR